MVKIIICIEDPVVIDRILSHLNKKATFTSSDKQFSGFIQNKSGTEAGKNG